MTNLLTLPGKLAPYRVTVDTDLPWAYQKANPQGRTKHDDWLVAKNTPRINTAFKVPLPFKKLAGNADPEWVAILRPELWTFAPGAVVENRVCYETGTTRPHVLTMTGMHPVGTWSRQAVWLGEKHGWTECHYARSMNIFGNKVIIYCGLKLDANPTDLMAWFPEASASIKWGHLG